MTLSWTRRFLGAAACVLVLTYGGPVLADGGGTMIVFDPTINATVEMGDIEVRNRCENDAQFQGANTQQCFQVGVGNISA